MDLSFIVSIIVSVLLLPLQVILIPVDALLAQIPGIGIIPSAIIAVTTFIGSLPSTLVNVLGINPAIWNVFFLTFILYVTASPAISVIKKVWAWVRP